MKGVVQRLALMAGGTLAALALLEASLHLVPALLPLAVRQALAIYGDNRQTLDLHKPFRPDDRLIHVPRPGVDVTIHDGLTLQYTVRTRSLDDPAVGFRDIGPTAAPYAVAVGDSLTWGTYVEAEQTWPEQLEALIAAPVLNMAVLGYGPIQYRIVTEAYALPQQPRAVLWGFFAGNDFVDSKRYADWEAGGKSDAGLAEPPAGLRDWLSRHVRLYELLRFALRTGTYHQRGTTEQATFVREPGGPDWTFYPEVLQELADGRRPDVADGWRLAQQAILATDRAARAAGVQFVVVIIPAKELVYWHLLRGRLSNPSAYDLMEPVRTLAEFCRARGLRCLDLSPDFMRRAAEGEELYLRQDAHLSPAGHERAARLVQQYVAQR